MLLNEINIKFWDKDNKMIIKLTLQQIIGTLQKTPEQSLFDWKADLCIDKNEDKRCEFVKDISAIANGTIGHDGYIFYGVNPNGTNPIVAIQNHLDDAQLQQIVNTKVKPEIDFVYYEVTSDYGTVGVAHISVSTKKPHIISCDYGKLREGQILIRRGSSTRGINFSDLWAIFYGPNSPYLRGVLQHYGSLAALINAETAYQGELRTREQSLLRQMENRIGLPPGTLSGAL